MKIKISPGMFETAEKADKRIMSYYKKGGNYTKLERERRFYYGTLGELSFVFLLRYFGKQAVYAPKWNGKADRGDVLIYFKDAGSCQLDIKTATQPEYQYMMIPETQFKLHIYPIYIGIRLDGELAEIVGFALRSDFENAKEWGVKVPIETMCVPLHKLSPIEELLEQIQDGETIITLPV